MRQDRSQGRADSTTSHRSRRAKRFALRALRDELLPDARLAFHIPEAPAKWRERVRMLPAIELATSFSLSRRIATHPIVPPAVITSRLAPSTVGHRLLGAWRYGERIVADAVLFALWQARSFARSAMREYPGDPESGMPTVVMLPGLATNWNFMDAVAVALSDEGFRVVQLPQLGRVTRSVNVLTEMVIRYLRSHRELGPVLFVSHSKGGLIAKRVLLEDPDAELALGAVAISAPFDGARAARLVRGRSATMREVMLLRPGSEPMLDLARNTSANSRITTISPIIDEIVGSRGTLPGARNLAVSSIGHNLLLADPRVHRMIVRELHRIMDAAAASKR